MRFHRCLLVRCVLILICSVALHPLDTRAQATVVRHVDASAPSGGDGTAWSAAYRYLQDALDESKTNPATTYEIWVAGGMYFPDDDGDGDHRADDPAETFRIAFDNVRLYGGFSGTETARSQRMPSLHRTVLSGDITQDDIVDADGVTERVDDIRGTNSNTVVFVDGTVASPITEATVIDGFTITGGSKGMYAMFGNYGGGLAIQVSSGATASPTLTTLRFVGNRSQSCGGGVAMYAFPDDGGEASPTFTDITFRHNASTEGGAVCTKFVVWINVDDFPGKSFASFSNVTFDGNSAGSGGGVAQSLIDELGGEIRQTFTHVTFIGNSGSFGGAIAQEASSEGDIEARFRQATFRDNSGGVLAAANSQSETSTTATFEESVVRDNTGSALTITDGGGLAHLTITESAFGGNTTGGSGGAIAIQNQSYGSIEVSLSNVSFERNTADQDGGALYVESIGSGFSSTLDAVTFRENAANGSGGAVHITSEGGSTGMTVRNAVFTRNEAQIGGAVHAFTLGFFPLYLDVTNAVFSGNRADHHGAGISVTVGDGDDFTSCHVGVAHATLSGNRAAQSGGGIYVDMPSPDLCDVEMANSILWGNEAGRSGAQIAQTNANPLVTHSLIEGASVDQDGDGDAWNDRLGIDGGGNLDADPRFADADGPDDMTGTADDDLRLRGPGGSGYSPAIDAGDNNAVPVDLTTDLAGLDRFIDVPGVPDTGDGSAPIVDMGAYESSSAPLPVELTAFTAVADGPAAVLSWTTASEQNNAGFEVQHRAGPVQASSREAWTTLGFIEGHGTTTQSRRYDYRAEALSPGPHSFRLRQIDTDGTTQPSEVVSVTVRTPDRLALAPPAPNPARGHTTIRYTLPQRTEVRLEVYDVRGRRVATLAAGRQEAGQQEVVYDAHRLPSGFYFVRLAAKGTVRTQKIAIVR